MIKGDWWAQVRKQAGPRYVTWSAQPIEVVVDFDKGLHAKLDQDPLLLQKLSDGGSDAYKAFIAECVGHVKWAEGLLEKAKKTLDKDRDPGAFSQEEFRILQGYTALMTNSVKKAEGDIAKAIDAAYAKHQKTRKEYKGYKIRAGIKIALKVTGISFAIAKLVGTMGADVLAWRSLIKDTIKTVTEITKLCAEAEKFRGYIEKELRTVRTWHAKIGDGKGATGSEVGLGLLRAVIGTDCEVTLDAVGSNVKQYRSKLQGVDLKAHKVARDLDQAIALMIADEKKVPAEIRNKWLSPLQTEVQKLIEEVIGLQEQVRDGLAWADRTDTEVKAMKKARSTSELARCVKLLETVIDGLTTTRGWVGFADKGGNLGVQISKTAVTAGKNIERHCDDLKALAS